VGKGGAVLISSLVKKPAVLRSLIGMPGKRGRPDVSVSGRI
jgi:hypothetical protein